MEALLSAKQLAVKPANDAPLREIDGDVWLRLRGGHLMFDLLEAIAAIHTADYMSPFGASSQLSLDRYLPKGPPAASQSTFPDLGR
jgi:hypothetical protein